MNIAKDNTYQLDGVVSDLRMKYDPSNNSTSAVLAVIKKRGTKKRKGPPKCGNGFETDYLPFANGHVVALELGGSDHPFNVVPQFEHWQGQEGQGEWRIMEETVYATASANDMMLVEIGYSRGGMEESHDSAYVAFHANKLRDWSDPRIPNFFKIRVWGGSHSLNTINNVEDFDAEVVSLGKNMPKYEKVFVLGETMPQPDRRMYVTDYAVTKAKERWKKATKQESFITWGLEPGVIDDVRDDLMDVDGVTAPEAMGMQLYPILHAAQANVSEPKIRKKIKEREKRGRKTERASEIFRDDSPKKK